MSNWKWDLNPTLEGTLLAVDRLGCGILVEDRDAILHYANRRILELTGYEAEELDGQPMSKLVPEELHGYLKDEEIPPLITLGPDLAPQRFIDLANARGGRDNITAVVVTVD